MTLEGQDELMNEGGAQTISPLTIKSMTNFIILTEL